MISLKPYRRAAVPLLAVHTADPAEIVRLAVTEANNGRQYPVVAWDCIHGIVPRNESGQVLADALNSDASGTPMDPAVATSNPVEALMKIEQLGGNDLAEKAIVLMLGMADVLADQQSGIPARQAMWNLRDVLPRQGVLLVLTVPMGWINPFPDDIAVIVSPLPKREQHQQTAAKLCEDAGIEKPDDVTSGRIGDAMLGLSSFGSEQAISLSLTKKGVDTESLWDRKKQKISETPGLEYYSGTETFADLGGIEQAKKLLKAILAGKRKPGAIIFVDEVEKAFAGSSSDTSGVAQALLGYWLSYMQDMNATGVMLMGPPGAAKSATGKAMGNEGAMPTVQLDLGGIKGSLVGESEQRMRTAFSVVTAISGDRPFFVATCNSIGSLPPEFRRRFTIGTIFFDFPTDEEKAVIWPIYLQKYDLPDQEIPECIGWTGAEIKQCCDLADRLDMSLMDAAEYVVPVSVSAADQLDKLRKEASGRYLSASHPGVYRYESLAQATSRKSRKIDLN